jgi:hypothetical protein
MSGVDDVQTGGTKHKAPYTPHNQIPTVQGYREEKHQREAHGTGEESQGDDRGKLGRLGEAYTVFRHGAEAANPNEDTQPYKAENKNYGQDEEIADDHAGRVQQKGNDDQEDPGTPRDTTEYGLSEQDPKKARKAMKKFNADGTEREVTDPVTHLPITIHDFTDKDLKMTPANGPAAGSQPETATGSAAMKKSDEQLHNEGEFGQEALASMETLFPPPDFQKTRDDITYVYRRAMTVGLSIVSVSLTLVVALFSFTRHSSGWSRILFTALEVAVSLGISAAVIVGMRQYTENRIKGIWDTEVWHAERQHGKQLAKGKTPESAQWLNSLLASIWPLINPDLFTSISDTLEDVMQASLPKVVRMVSVDDIGQGSQAFRILGVRWLPTGAATRSVSEDGKLKSNNKEKSDRSVPGEGQIQDSTNHQDKEENGQEAEDNDNMAEGMEAEEGDFINMEVAFAYRPSTGRKGMKQRAKSAHLYLAFYMPGNIKLRE